MPKQCWKKIIIWHCYEYFLLFTTCMYKAISALESHILRKQVQCQLTLYSSSPNDACWCLLCELIITSEVVFGWYPELCWVRWNPFLGVVDTLPYLPTWNILHDHGFLFLKLKHGSKNPKYISSNISLDNPSLKYIHVKQNRPRHLKKFKHSCSLSLKQAIEVSNKEHLLFGTTYLCRTFNITPHHIYVRIYVYIGELAIHYPSKIKFLS